jgi:hypothetical protein
MSSNGTVSFTKERPTLEIEGYTFRTRPVDPQDWAETLNAGATEERKAIKGGGTVLGVSAEGIDNLIRLAIVEEDTVSWQELRDKKLIDFGQLDSIRQWVWEQMTARPFTSDLPSGDGPGSDEASSKDKSSSPAAAEVH